MGSSPVMSLVPDRSKIDVQCCKPWFQVDGSGKKMVMVKNNGMIRMGGKGVEGSRLGAGCGGVWRQGRLE